MSLSPAEVKALLAEPAMEAPEGVTPSYDNPPNHNRLAWFITTFCMVIATFSFLVRLYSRVWQPRKLRIVEGLMLCGYGAYWTTAYAGYSMIYTPGYYVHQWNLYNKDLVQPLYLILVYGCAYSAVQPCLKTAILLDWCDIFVVHDKTKSPFWWGSMGVIALQVVWGISCVALLNMQCVPHRAIWEFYLESKCYRLPDVMLTSASVQVFSDVTMFLLPQKVIWGLNMNVQRRIGIAIMFGVGLLACVAASVRLATTVTFAGSEDQMYFIGPLLFWACAEMTCGFFILSVTCLPNVFSEANISRKVKKVLGIAIKSSSESPPAPNPHSSLGLALPKRKKSKLGNGMMNDHYYEMDDVTVKDSESQEQLRVQCHDCFDDRKGVLVTRTTQITVEDAQAGDLRGSMHPGIPPEAPWADNV